MGNGTPEAPPEILSDLIALLSEAGHLIQAEGLRMTGRQASLFRAHLGRWLVDTGSFVHAMREIEVLGTEEIARLVEFPVAVARDYTTMAR